MSKISTPYGISYNIHGHDGYNGTEKEPHVHIMCQGCRISISLNTCDIIEGRGQLDRNKEREVLEWVRNNLYSLMQEWKEKSNTY